VQIIIEVGIDPATYLKEQHQRRVRAPSACPNCKAAQTLQAHGYYWRWVAAAFCGLLMQIAVRRFRCWQCQRTVSCLPHFTQPYRLVVNQTIEAFFAGEKDRLDIQRWSELLASYQRRYQRWYPQLCVACGPLFGRSPPQEHSLGFWQRVIKACGGLAAATGTLVRQLAVTPFRTLPLPSAPGLITPKAEATRASPMADYPHTTCLWHSARGSANAPRRHGKRLKFDFAGASSGPSQRRQLD
jgi:hypothetical protein